MQSYPIAAHERGYRGFAFGHESPDFPGIGMAYVYPLTERADRLIRSMRGKPACDGEYEVNATHEAEVIDYIDEMWELEEVS
ncbi:MAG: hypothetical protein F4Z31_07720 [Gemmatimonadetes bacterium]|nr:hypothetical protein [Gemmatimonadota bacterium]MYJ09144.1 hypothetical protein [Gemmatimonadota bacterium]